jgi:hypothetical protein
MNAHPNAAHQTLALKVLAQYAGRAPGASGISAAAQRAYDELRRAAIPLIGQGGVEALFGRAVHLAKQDHPSLVHTGESDVKESPLASVILSLERQDAAVSMAAAAAVFATFTGLLVTLIGEALTTRLLRKAWPDAFSDTTAQEK